jgi:fatty acid synthase
VDVILNSLSEEKLQASVRILAQHGRFLEIGKFDLSNNTTLSYNVVSSTPHHKQDFTSQL